MYTKDQITSAIWEELKEANHTGDNNDRVYEVIGVVTAALERIKKPGLPPLPEPILTDKDVKDWEGEKRAHERKDTVEENWESFWKPIVTNEDGTINIDQVKKELHDFSFIMEQVPKVYCHITGNRMSKVMYHADTVIRVADDYFQEQLDEAVKDEKGETSAPLTQARAELIREANNRDMDGAASNEKDTLQRIKDLRLSDIDAPVFTHTKEFEAHFSYIKGKLMDMLGEKGTVVGREDDRNGFAEWCRMQPNYGFIRGIGWRCNITQEVYSTDFMYELFKQRKTTP